MSVSKRNILAMGIAASAFLVFAGPALAGGGSAPTGTGCTSNCGTGPVAPPTSTGRPGSTIGTPLFAGAGYPKAGCCGTPVASGGGVSLGGVNTGSVSVNVPGVTLAAPSIMVGAASGATTGFKGPAFNSVEAQSSAAAEPRLRQYYTGGGAFAVDEPQAERQIALQGGDERYFETITEQVPVTQQVCVTPASSAATISLRPVQAVCMDDKGRPNPASQVERAERVKGTYEGEIFRCMAGTSMQVTIGTYNSKAASFDGGETLTCKKGEALVHRSGKLSCATQIAARDCNERSLLRKYGPGLKVIESASAPACVMQNRTTYQSVTRQVERIRQLPSRPLNLTGGVGNGVN